MIIFQLQSMPLWKCIQDSKSCGFQIDCRMKAEETGHMNGVDVRIINTNQLKVICNILNINNNDILSIYIMITKMNNLLYKKFKSLSIISLNAYIQIQINYNLLRDKNYHSIQTLYYSCKYFSYIQEIMRNFSGTYSQFIQTGTDPGKYYPNPYSNQTKKHSNFKTFGVDLNENDMEMVLAKNFHKKSYPVDFGIINPFCPICGKFVNKNQQPLNYESRKFNKQFLAHEECLFKEESNSILSAMYQQNQQAKIIPFGLKRDQKSIALGGQQYYMQMKISHILSDFTFLKQSTKVSSSSSCILWQIHQDQQVDPYIPTIICVPLSDFRLTLILTCMATGQKTVYKTYINLGRLKYNQLGVVTAQSQELKVELRIFYKHDEKENLVDKMNFKYRYNLNLPMPIVEIAALQAIIPDDQEDEDQDFQSSVIGQVIDQSSEVSTVQITNKFHTQSSYSVPDNFSDRSQKQNFDLLITTPNLSSFVRNNSQSRQFQSFLNECSAKQVDLIIQTLYNDLPELIMHEYANYMVQKLFSVCNYTQRLKVMQRLHQDIVNIVRNKQGTHTIQSLIKFFTKDEQFELMCQSISQNLLQLSCHPNATHFIQKIIDLFPLIHTYNFFQFAVKNFLDFALDKNAMCVIKHMMKVISELEKNNPTDKIKQLTSQAKKRFVNQVTFCIDKIIQDSFGNYIIQFCYQLFGEDKCTGITQMITQRFPQFSLQKYSSSVVFKCVSAYWTKKESFNRLKQTLTPQAIIELFRNKDGNKILLEIMEKHQGIPVRDKINNQLMMGETTKFNHDRWGMVLGIRSGTVGTELKSFSDAMNKNSPKKGGKQYRQNYQ